MNDMTNASMGRPAEKTKVDLDGQIHDECGGVFRLINENKPVKLAQAEVVVEQELYKCSGCDEERQTLSQLSRARVAAAALVREHYGLLRPEEIRSIRRQLELTQPQLEAALGLGAKTVVRWETGKVLQPKSTDNLLRVLAKDPCALGFLAEHNGAQLPAGTLAVIKEAAERSSASPTMAETRKEQDKEYCTVSIPRRVEPVLSALAEREGMDSRSYVAWILAEQLTSACLSQQVDRRMDAMHADLKSVRKSVERAWSVTLFEKPYPLALPQQHIPLRRELPYAKRA